VEELAAEVDRVRLEGVDGKAGVPVEAQLGVLESGGRLRADVLALAGP
jgi:hypothetical protein